jgi:Mor family transcriptional regulator
MVQHQLGIYKRIFSIKQEEEIKQKHSQGMSLNKLSKQYSVSRDTITKIVNELYSTSHY